MLPQIILDSEDFAIGNVQTMGYFDAKSSATSATALAVLLLGAELLLTLIEGMLPVERILVPEQYVCGSRSSSLPDYRLQELASSEYNRIGMISVTALLPV